MAEGEKRKDQAGGFGSGGREVYREGKVAKGEKGGMVGGHSSDDRGKHTSPLGLQRSKHQEIGQRPMRGEKKTCGGEGQGGTICRIGDEYL